MPLSRPTTNRELDMEIEPNSLITKITQVIQRKDGSEVRIVVTDFSPNPIKPFDINVDVFRRDTPEQEWKLCSDRPHPDFKAMPREEYVKHGRSEKFQTVTHGEILRLTNLIGKPMSDAMVVKAQVQEASGETMPSTPARPRMR